MKFKYYDVLSQLVPGFVFYQVLILTINDLPKLDVLPSVAIAYLIGFFINSISSWLESLYYWTWGGKPSKKLLNGKGTKKIKIEEWVYLKENLSSESKIKNPNEDALFSIARRVANNSDNHLVNDFNSVYAFSRALLTTIILVGVLIFSKFFDNWLAYVIFLPLLLVSWYRTKERGYYYAKEVYSTYMFQKLNKNK